MLDNSPLAYPTTQEAPSGSSFAGNTPFEGQILGSFLTRRLRWE